MILLCGDEEQADKHGKENEQIFAIRRLGHGFDHERVQGEDEGAEGGSKQNGRRRGRRRYKICSVAVRSDGRSWPKRQCNENKQERRIQRMQQHAA
jgi:hypothetical protein